MEGSTEAPKPAPGWSWSQSDYGISNAVAKGHKRGFWLTSLIVGTSLLVWLTLLGSAFIAWAVYDVTNGNTSTTIISPSDSSSGSGSQTGDGDWTDSDGYTCSYYSTDDAELCPNNPSYTGY